MIDLSKLTDEELATKFKFAHEMRISKSRVVESVYGKAILSGAMGASIPEMIQASSEYEAAAQLFSILDSEKNLRIMAGVFVPPLQPPKED